MLRSKYFLTTLKENSKKAQIISHQLMLRAGMIQQHTSGIYSWLPLGNLVLQNIANIVREEHNKIGALEVTAPTLQSADLWIKSGRYNAYGKELLRIKDRYNKDLFYTPTAEELFHNLVQQQLKSYKELPVTLYQINWKFRDEIRPRFGVMRGREFYMKDAYSFDLSEEEAEKTYYKMLQLYIKIFKRMELSAIPLLAETGAVGGKLSHEFHIIAQTGESGLYYDEKLEILLQDNEIELEKILQLYAATEDKHDKYDQQATFGANIKQARGIEIGHTFYYGTQYSEVLGLELSGINNKPILPCGGCYGIGVSRLVAAIIEINHDDKGIIWPASVAPFKIGLLNLHHNDPICKKLSDECYKILLEDYKTTVLYDDRNERAGIKFADMDLIGLPWQLIISAKNASNLSIEIKNRKTGEITIINKNELLNWCQQNAI